MPTTTTTTLRAVRVAPMQLKQRPRAAAATAAVARPAAAAAVSPLLLSARPTQRQRRSMVVRRAISINAGPSAAAVAAARAASRVPVWLIPDISQLDATAAAAAWAVAQEIPLPSLLARAAAECGIAFLVAGLGVKLLGKLAVESRRVRADCVDRSSSGISSSFFLFSR